MKNLLKILFLLLFYNGYSQVLHHQMLSAQGGNSTASSGLLVKYTIGQQSVTGNTSSSYTVQQGFQQSNWERIIAKNNPVLVNTKTYPNPYFDVINFQFSQSIGDSVSLLLFDVLGRQVYSNTLEELDNKIMVNLQELPRAEYFVQLSNNKFTYHTKIIKN